MIVTDDDRIADLCRSLRNQGRDVSGASMPDPSDPIDSATLGSWLVHQRLGYNYRLSELHAALGVAQMCRLDELIEGRQRVAEIYTRRLSANPDLILPTVEPNIFMSWFVYVVRLNDRFTQIDRDYIIDGLRRHDVGSCDYFPPIPLQPYYRRRYGFDLGSFPAAESVSQRTVALPFFNRLTEREIDLVCQTLELMITRVSFSRS